MSTPTEGQEHSTELLKIFNQEAETTAVLELVAEEAKKETNNMSLVDFCEDIEALERRVKVHRLHIQQVKSEANEGGFQSKEKLEEPGDTPVGELAEVELPKE